MCKGMFLVFIIIHSHNFFKGAAMSIKSGGNLRGRNGGV